MSDWIKCSERLPSIKRPENHLLDNRYLVYSRGLFIEVANLREGIDRLIWLNDEMCEIGAVTHWMPLPDLPPVEDVMLDE